MKTLIITIKDITESGGGERVCINLANAFYEYLTNHKIIIISFFCANSTLAYNLHENIEIIYLHNGSAKPKNPIKKLFNKIFARTILNARANTVIRQNNAEIVLANDGWFIPDNNKQTTDIHYMRLWHLKAPKQKKKVFDRFDKLIVLSQKELPVWQSYHNNIHVIPNFLPTISKESAKYDQKIVLSVGRLTHEKGFLRLLDIWAILQNNHKNLCDWQLHIVGSGKQEQEIKQKIAMLHLEKSVILKPFNKNIQEEYLQASIYAMASIFEGFGMVLAEASSFGLPCIAFDINTGPSDIIQDCKSGFLIPDNDLEEFANKLAYLMNNQALRQKMGKKAKEIVSERFSKEVIITKWEKLFNNYLQ